MKKFHTLMLLLALGLAACGGNDAESELVDAQATAAELAAQLTEVAQSEEEPDEAAATATETQAPTATQQPTSTPQPTATDTPAPTATPFEVPDWPLFRTGDEGPEVYAIQQLLRVHGYNLSVDGDFGPQTRARVIEFQGDKNLATDGIIGPDTWAALIDIVFVKEDDSGRQVRAVQYLLRNKFDYNDVAVDGDFGPITDAAVRDFQQTYDLVVDGLVGPQTWQALIAIEP